LLAIICSLRPFTSYARFGKSPNGIGSTEPLGIRFHHFGHLIPSRSEWDRLHEQVQQAGYRIPLQGSVEGFLSYLYVDMRAHTGHFLEYILCEPAGQAFFDGLPRS